MSCPPELILAQFVDRALAEADAAATADHVAGCDDCRVRVDGLRREASLFREALAGDVAVPVIPAFDPPLSTGAWTVALLITGVGAGLASTVPVSLTDWLPWSSRFDIWALGELLLTLVPWLMQRGGALMTIVIEVIAALAALGALFWLARRVGPWRRHPLLLALPLLLAIGAAMPVQALDLRRSDQGTIHVPAGETIADTLIAIGGSVEIDGDVEGDLIAAGERVVVRGRVGGQVFAAAETVAIEGVVGGGVIGAGGSLSISGEVAGSVVGFAETLQAGPGRIGRNLYGFGKTVQVAPGAGVAGNAVLFSRDATVSAPIGADVLGFAAVLDLGSTVGGGVTAYAGRVLLLAPARVARDVTAFVPGDDRVTVSPGAEIGGELKVEIRAEEHAEEHDGVGGYVVLQLLRFTAAFLTGAVILALVPGLRRVQLDTVGQTLLSAGVGLVTLVAVPILALLTALTLIGLPLAVMGLVLWLAGLYLAKVVVGHYLGARILAAVSGEPKHFLVTLAVGLAVVIVAVNVPFIGGVASFLLTVVGLGLLVLFLWGAVRDRNRATAI
ncbi:MAG: hypothetical protein RIE74_05370 [Pseudomonadales bacterium]